MRTVRNITVAVESELYRARQKSEISRCIPVNASQPVYLQQLVGHGSASVQDKYLSIPTLKSFIPKVLRSIPQIALLTAVRQ